MTYRNLHLLPSTLTTILSGTSSLLFVFFLFVFSVFDTVRDPSIVNNPLTNLDTFKCFSSSNGLKERHAVIRVNS